MPPPANILNKRMTANPVRPARYRPGKAVQEEESSDETEEEEEEVPQKQTQSRPRPRPRPTPARPKAQKSESEEEEDDDDEEGFVTEDEDDTGGVSIKALQTSDHLTAAAQSTIPSAGGHPITTKEASSEEESDEESDDESEEVSSSEDEAPRRLLQRPTFIKKSDRSSHPSAPAQASNAPTPSEDSKRLATPLTATSTHDTTSSSRRLDEAEALIKLQIERDTIARLHGRKDWDDDEDLPPEALVDDTDDLDPATEHAAWRLREIKRLKRDREALIAREKDLEEVERRRGLSKEEREAEDRDFLEKQKAERDSGRGQASFLGKYHHKGAFFMDDDDDESVKKLRERSFAGAKFQDEVSDKSALPEYMRIRDMTKLGKKGRTRYVDMRNEDTGRFGDEVKRWRGSGYDSRATGDARTGYGEVDERFRPDGGPSASGANASVVGERRRRERQEEREEYRSRRRSYSRSRSRSRSPRRYSRSRSPEQRYRDRRSPSPYRDRDKRRRVEA